MNKKLSKRMTLFKKQIKDPIYEASAAFEILTKNAKAHESIEISLVMGIDPKKSDQVVKGVVEDLPAGLGKNVKIALFTKAGKDIAEKAGADYVGFEDLFEKVKQEEIDCDVYIATIDIMPELAKMGLGKILKGKMPNPKFGTIIEIKDIATTIKAKKAGQLPFRSNAHIINCAIGKASFEVDSLMQNYQSLLKTVASVRPQAVKPHNYFKKIVVSSTMGPGIQVNTESSLKGVKV